MCQFCHQHGEGRKWYLKAEHYAEELLADLERRKYMNEFIRHIGNQPFSSLEDDLGRAMRAPAWMRQLIFRYQERRYRRDHFGQVVPIEEIAHIVELANSVVRLPCICRKSTTGKRNAEYCFGLGLDPEKLLDLKESFLETFRPGPEVKFFERLTPTEALDLHRAFEAEGLIHTIWTFKTPFIGAICNCDRADCLAMVGYRYNLKLFFRGEYVARIESHACIGCRACMGFCQFGAIGFSVAHHRCFVDSLRCYGCGICRVACEHDAIQLAPRSDHPIAKGLW